MEEDKYSHVLARMRLGYWSTHPSLRPANGDGAALTDGPDEQEFPMAEHITGSPIASRTDPPAPDESPIEDRLGYARVEYPNAEADVPAETAGTAPADESTLFETNQGPDDASLSQASPAGGDVPGSSLEGTEGHDLAFSADSPAAPASAPQIDLDASHNPPEGAVDKTDSSELAHGSDLAAAETAAAPDVQTEAAAAPEEEGPAEQHESAAAPSESEPQTEPEAYPTADVPCVQRRHRQVMMHTGGSTLVVVELATPTT